MKIILKVIISFLLVININVLYGQQKFFLQATVPDNFSGKKIYLQIYDYYSLNHFYKLDSTIILNGKFSFTGTIKKPYETASLYIKKQTQSSLSGLNFVMNTGDNKITVVPNNKFDSSDPYSRQDTTLISSNANLIQHKLNAINTKFYKLYSKQIPGSVSGRYLENDKDRQLCIEQLDMLSQFPNEYYSLVWAYGIAQTASMARSTEFALEAFRKLGPQIRSTALGREFYLRETERVNAYHSAKANQLVPQFTVQTDKGSVFSNKELSGKPYIIAFSATWCIPCQEYQKKLLTLFHKYKNQNLKVVYFNLDDNVTIWKKHIVEKKLDWINVSERLKMDSSKIAKQFDVAAIPLYILVDKKGIITYNAD